MEVAGLTLLAGVLWALVRRYLQRVPRLERRLEDALVPPVAFIDCAFGIHSGRRKIIRLGAGVGTTGHFWVGHCAVFCLLLPPRPFTLLCGGFIRSSA